MLEGQIQTRFRKALERIPFFDETRSDLIAESDQAMFLMRRLRMDMQDHWSVSIGIFIFKEEVDQPSVASFDCPKSVIG